jgi:hypothetical protein
MFSRNTVFVWTGIILLSGIFLMGQDGWSPTEDRIVFVSTTVVTGAMLGGGGLEEADQVCMDDALSAELPNGISYKAWLSDSTESPDTRFREKRGRFILVDGTLIAQNWGDLTDGKLTNPIIIDANGGTVPQETFVWTNTLANGKANNAEDREVDSCVDWYSDTDAYTGWYGDPYAFTSEWWTNRWRAICERDFRLYCFEQL